MKRKLFCLLTLCALLTLTACAKENKPLPACEELAKAVVAGQAFTPDLYELKETKLQKLLDVTAADYTDAYATVDASHATAEAVLVLTAADSAGAKQLAEKLEAYRLDTLAQYQGYRPEEAPKLNAAKVYAHGLQCVLAIAPDQDQAKADCEALWSR